MEQRHRILEKVAQAGELKGLGGVDLGVLERRYMAFEPDGLPTDIHRATAAELFRVPYAEVTPEQRCEGKRLNYLKIYGG